MSMALGLSSQQYEQKISILYVFGKSAVRGFEYFSKLLYVAVNKKVAPLKATENEITNAFEHSECRLLQ
jgi:hypothetical protein